MTEAEKPDQFLCTSALHSGKGQTVSEAKENCQEDGGNVGRKSPMKVWYFDPMYFESFFMDDAGHVGWYYTEHGKLTGKKKQPVDVTG